MTPKSLLHPARLARRPVLSTQSDARLVDLVRAGYDPAFETIVERYRRPLLRYAGSILRSERAEDVVQLAFVKAYEAVLRDSRQLDLRPWLYRIVHNASLNALRDQRPASAELSEQLDGVERPDQVLERRQGLRELLAAVQALPWRQREAIVLRELEGRSYDEIASALGVTDGAVRQLLNRARNTLRAGATALVPAGWVARIPWEATAEPLATRLGEGLGAAGVGAVAAKLCATALVTGAVVGGAAAVPDGGSRASGDGEARAAETDRSRSAGPGTVRDADSLAFEEGNSADRSGPGGHDGSGGGPGERSGRGDGDGSDDSEDREGPGDGDGRDSGDGDSDGGDGASDDDDRSGSSPGEDRSGSGGGDGSSGESSGDQSSGSGGESGESVVDGTVYNPDEYWEGSADSSGSFETSGGSGSGGSGSGGGGTSSGSSGSG